MPATLTDVADAFRKLDAVTADRGGPVAMLIQLALDDAARANAEAGRGDWPKLLNESFPAPALA